MQQQHSVKFENILKGKQEDICTKMLKISSLQAESEQNCHKQVSMICTIFFQIMCKTHCKLETAKSHHEIFGPRWLPQIFPELTNMRYPQLRILNKIYIFFISGLPISTSQYFHPMITTRSDSCLRSTLGKSFLKNYNYYTVKELSQNL